MASRFRGTVGESFGSAVAISGDTAAVGANVEDTWRGAAYVFTRSDGVWTGQQKLTASDAAAEARFGWSVALYGDTLAVGAYSDQGRGAAYVFTRAGGVWTEREKLTASDGAANDRLGWSVALFGDTVAAGAPMKNDPEYDSGAAYAFTIGNLVRGTGWALH